jgi:hypothetical protein
MLDAPAFLAIGAAFTAGLISIPHCAGMCGPLAGFACSRAERGIAANARYQGGRLVAYAALGAVAGAASSAVTSAFSNAWAFAVASWLMAAALLVAAHRLWADRSATALASLRPRSRFARFTGAISRNLPREPAAYGAITALLPCGALYAALLIAAGASSPIGGALAMIVFAVVSSVGLVAFGWFANRASRARNATWKRVLAVALLVGAVLLGVRPVASLTREDPEPACCHHG